MNRSHSCPNLCSVLSHTISNDKVTEKPISTEKPSFIEICSQLDICHCKFIKNNTLQNNSFLSKLFNVSTKLANIILPIDNDSLLSLNKTYTDKCHTLRIPKIFCYMPKIESIALYHNRKFKSYDLLKNDKRYWQDQLFCLSKKSNNLCKYLKDIGYDIDIISQLNQILYQCYHKKYNIIWLDANILSESHINHAIYILRIMYHYDNTIIVMVPDLNIFDKLHSSTEVKLEKTESASVYKFNYIQYINIHKLFNKINRCGDINVDTASQELIVSCNISHEHIVQYLNNKFYVGCNIIKPNNISKTDNIVL